MSRAAREIAQHMSRNAIAQQSQAYVLIRAATGRGPWAAGCGPWAADRGPRAVGRGPRAVDARTTQTHTQHIARTIKLQQITSDCCTVLKLMHFLGRLLSARLANLASEDVSFRVACLLVVQHFDVLKQCVPTINRIKSRHP